MNMVRVHTTQLVFLLLFRSLPQNNKKYYVPKLPAIYSHLQNKVNCALAALRKNMRYVTSYMTKK